ncbi:MAG: transglycosylase SLT domain-containing protein [Giesbergeria sp.]
MPKALLQSLCRIALVLALGLLGLAVVASCTAAFAQVPPHAVRYRLDLVRQAQAQWGLQAPVAALAAQVHQESGWRPGAVSHAGAQGMAQFMPATARWWCARGGEAAADCLPLNPRWALRAMVGYDKFLYDRTPARLARYDRLWLALRGYNGGEGHWQAEGRSTGLAAPTRAQIDAACGAARRHPTHCAENLGYPRRILLVLQPRYRTWGAVWEPTP